MNRKLIITRQDSGIAKGVAAALFEDGLCVEINFIKAEEEKILGNIYVGKVKDIVMNINAAFVEIAPGQPCYYSFEDNKRPIFTTAKKSRKINIGDELLVQVSKENIKTKAPVVTSNLNFTGKYTVLTTGNTRIGVSAKIRGRRRQALTELAETMQSDAYGFVIRTNAAEASDGSILQEMEQLVQSYEELLAKARFRTCYSMLAKAPDGLLGSIRDVYTKDLTAIVTDDPQLYGTLDAYLSGYQPEDRDKLVMYEDDMLPLGKLYSLETEIKAALKERVWLKSGGYLIIQSTEAFVVIDVNTGKFTGKKEIQDTFLKINMEAAKEIARQLRLRNLSGIILVDFIDLKGREAKQKLMDAFRTYLNQDPVQTTLVGMTALNIVEVTRRKAKKPLKELLTIPCPACSGNGYRY